ncbi:DUF1127 domain-containing protein [Mesorhizobium robiniae]|uniref:DUF1127 domain-containing protein n=1 Tax=Mesorhizobium robiniae TaxID=559315 RepID=UPI00339228E6
MNDTLASASPRTARPGACVVPTEMPRRHYSLMTLQNIVATWSERKRVRWQLKQMSKDNPHLIDDIGLTGQQFEEEIAKPFWQA